MFRYAFHIFKVPRFPVLRFPPLRFGPEFSSPTFSASAPLHRSVPTTQETKHERNGYSGVCRVSGRFGRQLKRLPIRWRISYGSSSSSSSMAASTDELWQTYLRRWSSGRRRRNAAQPAGVDPTSRWRSIPRLPLRRYHRSSSVTSYSSQTQRRVRPQRFWVDNEASSADRSPTRLSHDRTQWHSVPSWSSSSLRWSTGSWSVRFGWLLSTNTLSRCIGRVDYNLVKSRHDRYISGRSERIRTTKSRMFESRKLLSKHKSPSFHKLRECTSE